MFFKNKIKICCKYLFILMFSPNFIIKNRRNFLMMTYLNNFYSSLIFKQNANTTFIKT